jgi:hypothetical protein
MPAKVSSDHSDGLRQLRGSAGGGGVRGCTDINVHRRERRIDRGISGGSSHDGTIGTIGTTHNRADVAIV